MRPSRPALNGKSDEELRLILSSSEYIPEVRVDARDLMLHRGADPCEVSRLFALGMGSDRQRPTWQRPWRELLGGDTRKPVLYLRPFSVDKEELMVSLRGERARSETMTLGPLEMLGPVVAIGRPGEVPVSDQGSGVKRERGMGAARVFAQGDWQNLFCELLDAAQVVIIFAGTTTSLQWEVDQVFQKNPFVPTIVLLPFAKRWTLLSPDRDKIRQDLRVLGEKFKTNTGFELSEDLKSARVVFFHSRTDKPMMVTGDPRSLHEYGLNYLASPYHVALARVVSTMKPELEFQFRRQGFLTLTAFVLGAIVHIAMLIHFSHC